MISINAKVGKVGWKKNKMATYRPGEYEDNEIWKKKMMKYGKTLIIAELLHT